MVFHVSVACVVFHKVSTFDRPSYSQFVYQQDLIHIAPKIPKMFPINNAILMYSLFLGKSVIIKKFVKWYRLDFNICKYSYNIFRTYLLKSICPLPNPVLNIHKVTGFWLLTRWRFCWRCDTIKILKTINSFCTCVLEVEWKPFFLILSSLQCYLQNSLKWAKIFRWEGHKIATALSMMTHKILWYSMQH